MISENLTDVLPSTHLMPTPKENLLNKFEIDNSAQVSGTSFWNVEITVNPIKLIALLGDSNESDGYKVSKEWVFRLKAKPHLVFTLYDYKETSLYDKGNPSPERYWSGIQDVHLHIGHMKNDIKLAKELAFLILEGCR